MDAEIRDEIDSALTWLGGSPELVASLRGATKDQLYDAVEALTGDRLLLAVIDRWGDTLDDAEVLAHLRDWNRNAAADAIDRVRQGHGAIKVEWD